MLPVRQSPAAPDDLEARREPRVVVQVNRVRNGIVERQEADAAIGGLLGEVDGCDASEGEGDGGVRRVRVGCGRVTRYYSLGSQHSLTSGAHLGRNPRSCRNAKSRNLRGSDAMSGRTATLPACGVDHSQVNCVESDEMLCVTAPMMAPCTRRGARARSGTIDAKSRTGIEIRRRGMVRSARRLTLCTKTWRVCLCSREARGVNHLQRDEASCLTECRQGVRVPSSIAPEAAFSPCHLQ